MIISLSFMFSSGLARNSASINSTASIQFCLLNGGVVLFFLGFSGIMAPHPGEVIGVVGLLSMMISVLAHLVNILRIVEAQRMQRKQKRDFKDGS